MKTNNLKAILMFVAMLIAGTSISFAQHNHEHQHQKGENHAHKAPHNGVVKTAGDYHIEMVVDMQKKEDKVTFYLLDEKEKTMANKDITGTAMFLFDDKTTVTETLVAKGNDRFIAQLKDNKDFTAVVTLKVKGKTVTAKFEHKGSAAPKKDAKTNATIYECPMKCEKSSKPGKCSKCGMTLEEKKQEHQH